MEDKKHYNRINMKNLKAFASDVYKANETAGLKRYCQIFDTHCKVNAHMTESGMTVVPFEYDTAENNAKLIEEYNQFTNRVTCTEAGSKYDLISEKINIAKGRSTEDLLYATVQFAAKVSDEIFKSFIKYSDISLDITKHSGYHRGCNSILKFYKRYNTDIETIWYNTAKYYFRSWLTEAEISIDARFLEHILADALYRFNKYKQSNRSNAFINSADHLVCNIDTQSKFRVIGYTFPAVYVKPMVAYIKTFEVILKFSHPVLKTGKFKVVKYIPVNFKNGIESTHLNRLGLLESPEIAISTISKMYLKVFTSKAKSATLVYNRAHTSIHAVVDDKNRKVTVPMYQSSACAVSLNIENDLTIQLSLAITPNIDAQHVNVCNISVDLRRSTKLIRKLAMYNQGGNKKQQAYTPIQYSNLRKALQDSFVHELRQYMPVIVQKAFYVDLSESKLSTLSAQERLHILHENGYKNRNLKGREAFSYKPFVIIHDELIKALARVCRDRGIIMEAVPSNDYQSTCHVCGYHMPNTGRAICPCCATAALMDVQGNEEIRQKGLKHFYESNYRTGSFNASSLLLTQIDRKFQTLLLPGSLEWTAKKALSYLEEWQLLSKLRKSAKLSRLSYSEDLDNTVGNPEFKPTFSYQSADAMPDFATELIERLQIVNEIFDYKKVGLAEVKWQKYMKYIEKVNAADTDKEVATLITQVVNDLSNAGDKGIANLYADDLKFYLSFSDCKPSDLARRVFDQRFGELYEPYLDSLVTIGNSTKTVREYIEHEIMQFDSIDYATVNNSQHWCNLDTCESSFKVRATEIPIEGTDLVLPRICPDYTCRPSLCTSEFTDAFGKRLFGEASVFTYSFLQDEFEPDRLDQERLQVTKQINNTFNMYRYKLFETPLKRFYDDAITLMWLLLPVCARRESSGADIAILALYMFNERYKELLEASFTGFISIEDVVAMLAGRGRLFELITVAQETNSVYEVIHADTKFAYLKAPYSNIYDLAKFYRNLFGTVVTVSYRKRICLHDGLLYREWHGSRKDLSWALEKPSNIDVIHSFTCAGSPSIISGTWEINDYVKYHTRPILEQPQAPSYVGCKSVRPVSINYCVSLAPSAEAFLTQQKYSKSNTDLGIEYPQDYDYNPNYTLALHDAYTGVRYDRDLDFTHMYALDKQGGLEKPYNKALDFVMANNRRFTPLLNIRLYRGYVWYVHGDYQHLDKICKSIHGIEHPERSTMDYWQVYTTRAHNHRGTLISYNAANPYVSKIAKFLENPKNAQYFYSNLRSMYKYLMELSDLDTSELVLHKVFPPKKIAAYFIIKNSVLQVLDLQWLVIPEVRKFLKYLANLPMTKQALHARSMDPLYYMPNEYYSSIPVYRSPSRKPCKHITLDAYTRKLVLREFEDSYNAIQNPDDIVNIVKYEEHIQASLTMTLEEATYDNKL